MDEVLAELRASLEAAPDEETTRCIVRYIEAEHPELILSLSPLQPHTPRPLYPPRLCEWDPAADQAADHPGASCPAEAVLVVQSGTPARSLPTRRGRRSDFLVCEACSRSQALKQWFMRSPLEPRGR